MHSCRDCGSGCHRGSSLPTLNVSYAFDQETHSSFALIVCRHRLFTCSGGVERNFGEAPEPPLAQSSILAFRCGA